MAKSKYETHVAPFLDQIASWKKQGISLKEMAEKLRVAESSLDLYLKKGREGQEPYSEFSGLYDTVDRDLTENVESSLYRKTQGYNAKLKKHFKVKCVEYDEVTGKKIREFEELREVEDEVHVPADTQAIIFYLTRRAPKKWPLKPPEELAGEGQTGVIMMAEPEVADLQPPPEVKAMLDAKFAAEDLAAEEGSDG